jgi:phage baseplate assembly protein W
MPTLYGAPYPIRETPNGYLPPITDMNVLMADLKQLILTNPGERVMMPEFGTPLSSFLFDQNDQNTYQDIKLAINKSISTWDPRIIVQSINVVNGFDYYSQLNLSSTKRNITDEEVNNLGNTALLILEVINPDKINQIETLVLELPLMP